MDGVLADFENGFLQNWTAQHPDKSFIPVEERHTFHLTEQYPAEWRGFIYQIFCTPQFFRRFTPMEGGVEALHEMKRRGIEVYICTTPLEQYQNCVLEKYEWVEEFLGREWTSRVILTRDKTLIKADILIDDNPYIKGADTPSWEHVLYDQPYNRAVADKRRLTWDNWKAVLLNKSR